jgi:hypothetical protein
MNCCIATISEILPLDPVCLFYNVRFVLCICQLWSGSSTWMKFFISFLSHFSQIPRYYAGIANKFSVSCPLTTIYEILDSHSDSYPINITVIWDGTPYCLVDRQQYFKGICCLHLQNRRPNYTAPHPRRM